MNENSRSLTLPLAAPLLALLALVYVLTGLVGHDPWKTEDAIGIGIVHQMLTHGQWLVPHLAGEPFFEDGPFYYWIAALTAKIFGSAFAMHDGARLASGLLTGATLWLVHLAGRELYGRSEGASAALVLLGCLGLLVHAHETLAEIGMLAGQALALYAIALALRQPWRAGWLLGAGIADGGPEQGTPGRDRARCDGSRRSACLQRLAAARICADTRRRRAHRCDRHRRVACAAPGTLAGLDDRMAERPTGRLGVPDWKAPGYYAETLGWAAWPAWPIALWALWERRHRPFEPGTRMLSVAALATLAAVFLQPDVREVNGLPLLLPLAVLAGAGVPSLRRGAANALAWFGVMSTVLFGVLVWLGWIAMMTGVPAQIARNFAKLEPGHMPQFSWPAFAVAVALTLAWAAVLVTSERSAAHRSVTFWAAGITLLWGLVMTLLLPWIDYGKTYRPVALALKKAVLATERRLAQASPRTIQRHCIDSRGLGEAQRAAFDYHAGIVTERLELRGNANARCPLLLVQGGPGDNDRVGEGWKLLWEGSRPRDRERYRLYQKQQ